MTGSVFSTDWYNNFLAFQRNPKAFIDSRKLTRDEFCMDILKDLYSDDVTPQCKCHLLLSLQEHQSYLIQNEELLEQVIGSLHNLFMTFESNNNRLFKTYIIVTVTTLLLSWKNSSDVISRLCTVIRNVLLDIIFKEANDHVLRSTACRCLEEMEMFYPCFLKDKIDSLMSVVKSSQFLPIQNYVILLSISLKHRTDDMILERKRDNAESDTKMSIQQKTVHPHHRSSHQMHHYVSCILEALPALSEPASYLVYKNLIHIVENTPDLLPAVFKPYLPKLIMSSDVLHFYLAFILLQTFGSDLFNSQEEKQLLQQLIMSLKQPSFISSQRLLYLDWLRTLIMQKDVLPVVLSKPYLEILIPGPFDGSYTQEKKISLLSLYFFKNSSSFDSSDFLLRSLTGLKRQTLFTSSVSTVTSFFRSLYSVFFFHDNAAICTGIQKMILEVMSSNSQLSPFVLDFLKCVKKDKVGSSFSSTLYSMLVDRAVNLTQKQFAQDFTNLSPILEAVIMEPPDISKPQAILRQLKKLLMEPTFLPDDTWVIGHNILTICCSILKFHDIEILYHDLGELLNLVMRNITNPDCQDRAKQYYAALTALPQARVKSLFKNQSLEKKGNISLNTIINENETMFHSKSVKLTTPVLELIRLERSDLCFRTQYEIQDKKDNLAASYLEFISSEQFQAVVRIPFLIRQIKDIPEQFSSIYCVVITVKSSPDACDISDIEVPVLKCCDTNYGIEVDIEFVPKRPAPIVLQFSGQFTSCTGSSYKFTLPSIKLQFQNLFFYMPLLADEIQKNQLFDELWTILQKNNRCLSSFCLKVPEADLEDFVNSNWKPFLMGQTSNLNYNIVIFFPPTSHMLLRVTAQNGYGFVTILTEREILPLVNCYMKDISKQFI